MVGAVRVEGATSLDKAGGIVAAFPEVWNGTVIDIGCRTRELEQSLSRHPVRYIGVDLEPPADVVASLEDPLPFEDGAADVVVALDVLEHVDAIYAAFDELCRVSRRHVIISLPNCSVVDYRLKQMRGQLGRKYGLPEEPPGDRHRWLFSLDDARRFCRRRAEVAGWRVADEVVIVGPKRRRVEPLVRAHPNLLAPTLVTHVVPAA
jgi:SAM-dependent methyltransferase